MKKNLLVVAAHPDDEILGCCGSLLKFKNQYQINVIFMTDGVSSRYKSKTPLKKKNTRIQECLNVFKFLKFKKPSFYNFPDNKLDSVPLINLIKTIEKNIKKFKPEIVITHFENCLNVDHQIVYKAVITAARPIHNSSVRKILSFEIPSSTNWALFKKNTFAPNYYVDISKNINKKIKALKMYKSELRKFPHSRSLRHVKNLAQLRGSDCGVSFAEAFILVRNLHK